MIEAWVEALDDARRNEAVQVVVVTAGRAFCSGGDVGNMARDGEATGLSTSSGSS